MATNLTGTKIKDTFGQLLHIDGGATSSQKTVYDGDGTATALSVSTTDVQVNSSPVVTDADIGSSVQATLVSGTNIKTINGSTILGSGNLVVGGSGTVTSVAMTVPTGLTVSGSPVTTTGTLAVTLTSGYSIPTTSSQTNWDSAYTQRLQWDGGSTNLVAATGRTSLGVTATGSDTTYAYRANNLSDLASASTARTNLGLGTAATMTGPSGTIVGTSDSQTLTNKTLTDPAITGTILEDVFTITDGASVDIDPGNGSVQVWTLGASRTPTATNFAAGESVTLMIADGTAYSVTWSTIGVVWTGGSAPTLPTSGYGVIVLWKVGSTVYGKSVGDVA